MTSTRTRRCVEATRTWTTSVGPAPPCWTALATSSLSISATRWRTPSGRPASIEMTERRAMLAALVPPGRENEAVFGSAKGQSDGWSEANLPHPPDPGYAGEPWAPWRSGYAAACKAVYTGSIPVGAFSRGAK